MTWNRLQRVSRHFCLQESIAGQFLFPGQLAKLDNRNILELNKKMVPEEIYLDLKG